MSLAAARVPGVALGLGRSPSIGLGAAGAEVVTMIQVGFDRRSPHRNRVSVGRVTRRDMTDGDLSIRRA